MKIRVLRWIGRALFVLSLFIIIIWRFSSHRWLAGALSQFFLELFVIAFSLAGLGAIAMRIADEIETCMRDKDSLSRMLKNNEI